MVRKNGVPDATVRIVKNASLEAQLLFLRKLNEFFKPLATDKELEEDDLRAEHYAGFKSPGPFLSRPDEKEIHKRVGHITLMEARYGKKDWPELMEGSSLIAVDSLLKFFRFLRDSYPSLSSAKREDVQYHIRRLEQLKRHV